MTVLVKPVDAGTNPGVFNFDVLGTAPSLIMVNHTREVISQNVLWCMQDHWTARMEPDRPSSCQTRSYPPYLNFSQYPFRSLNADLTASVCAANPERLALDVDVELQIRGEPRCVQRQFDTGYDPKMSYDLARNYRMNCAEVPGEGGAFERSDGPIGEGQGFGVVEDAAPDDTFRGYDALPGTRLPGFGLRSYDTEGWQQCRDDCTADEDCKAWTYRFATSLCRLKTGADQRVADECCRSGIKLPPRGAEISSSPGTGADAEAPAESGGGAAVRYTPMPNIRLPGNDIRQLPAANWQACRDACTAEAGCGAFTFRRPSSTCLLKRGAGLPVPDPCCSSGVKQ